MEILFSLEEIDFAVRQFWDAVGHKRIFAFHGPLGAGKTTFIAALCRAKGIEDEPSSPTFSLINDYLFLDEKGEEQHFYHIDAYRIRAEEEAVQAGIEDCLLSESICFVEWPEKIPNLLPEETLHTYITVDKGERTLQTI